MEQAGSLSSTRELRRAEYPRYESAPAWLAFALVLLAAVIGVVVLEDCWDVFFMPHPETAEVQARMILSAGKWVMGMMLATAGMLLAFVLAGRWLSARAARAE